MAMLDIFNRPSRAPGRPRSSEDNPLINLHREMNEMFEDFWRSMNGDLEPFARQGYWPKLDVSEDDKAVTVRADLPGMEEKDVEVSLAEGVLTIRGEHEETHEEKEKDYHVRERQYGHFHRTIPVGRGIDEENVKAEFKNGVLTVTLPKTEEAKERTKKIPISS